MCGISLRTTTTLAGASALIQSCFGLGSTIFFILVLYYPEKVINIEKIEYLTAWHTLFAALHDGYFETIRGITITACVFNFLWLTSTVALLIGNLRKNHQSVQAWVFVTAFTTLYDAIATIIFVTTTASFRTLKETKAFEPDYSFYILEVFSFGKLGPITIVLNAVFCYYVQKRTFEIFKQKRAKEGVVRNNGPDILNGRKGKGVYREESIPNDNYNLRNALEMSTRNQFRPDEDNRRRNTIEDDYRDINIPRTGFQQGPNPNHQSNEMVDQRLKGFESDYPRPHNLERPEANSMPVRPYDQPTGPPPSFPHPPQGVYVLPQGFPQPPTPGVYGQPQGFSQPPPTPGVYGPPQGFSQPPTPGVYGPPREPQVIRNDDPRNLPMARPPFSQAVNQNYLKPAEEQRPVQRSPAPNTRYNKAYVPTPFIPPADYNPNLSDSDDERSGHDNRGYEDDGRQGYPQHNDPRQPGRNVGTQPHRNVAQMRDQVERNNSNRQPRPPPRLTRQGSNRSVQSDRPGYGNGHPPRPVRVLPEPARRPQNRFPEEDERFYRQPQYGNARNYDSEPEYRQSPRGYLGPESRSRF